MADPMELYKAKIASGGAEAEEAKMPTEAEMFKHQFGTQEKIDEAWNRARSEPGLWTPATLQFLKENNSEARAQTRVELLPNMLTAIGAIGTAAAGAQGGSLPTKVGRPVGQPVVENVPSEIERMVTAMKAIKVPKGYDPTSSVKKAVAEKLPLKSEAEMKAFVNPSELINERTLATSLKSQDPIKGEHVTGNTAAIKSAYRRMFGPEAGDKLAMLGEKHAINMENLMEDVTGDVARIERAKLAPREGQKVPSPARVRWNKEYIDQIANLSGYTSNLKSAINRYLEPATAATANKLIDKEGPTVGLEKIREIRRQSLPEKVYSVANRAGQTSEVQKTINEYRYGTPEVAKAANEALISYLKERSPKDAAFIQSMDKVISAHQSFNPSQSYIDMLSKLKSMGLEYQQARLLSGLKPAEWDKLQEVLDVIEGMPRGETPAINPMLPDNIKTLMQAIQPTPKKTGMPPIGEGPVWDMKEWNRAQARKLLGQGD